MSDIGIQEVLGSEAYRALEAGGLVPATLPANDIALESVLNKAREHPNAVAFKDAIDAVKGAAHVVGLPGIIEGLNAIEALGGGDAALRFKGMVHHPALAGARTAMATKTLNLARADYLKDVPKPSEIVKHLDRYVIGQRTPKMIVANAVYAHYKRIATIEDCKKRGEPVPETLLKKNNILLVGPTGTGKTLLARTIAKILKVPFVIVDATTLTEAGYVGEDVDSILVRLLDAADHNVARAQRGIIYIDEIDKKSKPEGENVSITRDVSGAGVQDALLKIVEGTVANVHPQGGRKDKQTELLQIRTDDILFIAGGAFSGIEKMWAKRTQPKGGFGFNSTIIDPTRPLDLEEACGNLEPSDFISYGMKPEFIGRFPAIAGLLPLGVPELRRVITEPNDAVRKQWESFFAPEGVELVIKPKAVKAIAELAIKRGTGGRGLPAIFEQVFRQASFNIPDRPEISKIVLGDDLRARCYKGKKQQAV